MPLETCRASFVPCTSHCLYSSARLGAERWMEMTTVFAQQGILQVLHSRKSCALHV